MDKPPDPTKFSPLNNNLTPQDLINGRSREYFLLFNHKNLQHFIVLLSKGILNVSDVVTLDGENKYSHRMNLSSVEPFKNFKIEREVELFLLNYVFDDNDHWIRHNLIEDESLGSFVTFDYDDAFETDNATYLDKLFDPDNFMRLMDPNDKLIFTQACLEKLDSFESALSDSNFFHAIVEKSGINFDAEYMKSKKTLKNLHATSEESFRNYLLERVRVLKKCLERVRISITTSLERNTQ